MNQFTASIWGDEGFSAILSQKSIPDIISTISRDTSPPLYNILEHFWFRIFGSSEVSIRSMSFLFFVFILFFVYKIGKSFWDTKTGLIAAMLTALNPFLFSYAFEGRMYSLLALTTTASVYYFLKKSWIPFVLFTAASLYTHHFSIFALGAEGIWFLVTIAKKDKKSAWGMFKSFIFIGLLYLPWMLPLYNQTKMVAGGFWLSTPTLGDLRELIYKYLATGISHPLSQISLYIVLGILILRKWLISKEKTLFLIIWALFPITFTWVLSQKIQSIFYDRYLLITIPAFMLIIASNLRKFSFLLVAAVLICFAVIDFNYFTHPTKKPFREFAAMVKENKRGDDYLINWNGQAHHLWETKYYQIPAPIYLAPGKSIPFFAGTALMEKQDLVSSLPKKAYRILAITSDDPKNVKIDGFNQIDVKEVGALKLVFLKKK